MKTIGELLTEGRAKLAAREQEARDKEAAWRVRQQHYWEKLLEVAKVELGQLYMQLPEDPPEDFLRRDQQSFPLFPFGNPGPVLWAGFYAHYWEGGGGQVHWECMARGPYDHGHIRPAFRVSRRYAPGLEETPDGDWYVPQEEPYQYDETDNLAEALALCERAKTAYESCRGTCQATEPPHRPDPTRPKPKVVGEDEKEFLENLYRMLDRRYKLCDEE